jgi:predicted transcriptional regulator
MRPTDLSLLTIVAEPKARRIVSEAYALPTGAIPVLAALGFKDSQGQYTRPREIYEAKMGSETLIRYYISTLVKAGLVERLTTYRIKKLRLTSKGLLAVGRYEREIRAGYMAFGQVHIMRVLTALPMR